VFEFTGAVFGIKFFVGPCLPRGWTALLYRMTECLRWCVVKVFFIFIWMCN